MSSALLLTAFMLLLPIELSSQDIPGNTGDPLIAGAHNTVTVTACTNYNPDKLTFTTLTKGGQLPYTYQWQSGSSASGPWTDINGATDLFYDPPNLMTAGIFCFHCRITDNSGSVATTIPKMVVIVPDPTVTVSGGGIVNQNSYSLITSIVKDGTGIISYQWLVSLTGTSGWIPIPGEIASSYKIATSSVGLFYYRVHADASGAACSKPYSAIIPVIIIPDKSPPIFTAPTGPFVFCVENIAQANFWSPGPGVDPYRPDFFLFRKGDRSFDLDPSFFIDDCDSIFEFQIRWQISVSGNVIIAGAGQPSDHDSFEIPGSPTGPLMNEITWWISDCNGNESLPASRSIVIKPRPQIIIN